MTPKSDRKVKFMRLTRIISGLAFAIVFAVANLPAHAAGIGDKLPHALNVADQSGAERSFDTLKGGKGLILLFTRSLDW